MSVFRFDNFRMSGCTLAVAGFVAISGCSSQSNASKGAADGATTGAIAGAVGAMAGALVFGGNVAEAGARGAVVGGASGATVGAMSGSKRDQAEAAQKAQTQEEQAQKLREQLGDDAFDGVVALAKCNYGVAIANAQVAQQSKKKDYALAGLWVEVLTYADQRDEAKARALFPDVIKRDKKIKSEAQAEEAMRDAIQSLADIRVDNNLPKICPA
jgi:hypothetical protein